MRGIVTHRTSFTRVARVTHVEVLDLNNEVYIHYSALGIVVKENIKALLTKLQKERTITA